MMAILSLTIAAFFTSPFEVKKSKSFLSLASYIFIKLMYCSSVTFPL
jgi:hypothetical protein